MTSFMTKQFVGIVALLFFLVAIRNSDGANIGLPRPYISECATWNTNATIIASQSLLKPFGIFIDNVTNSVCIASPTLGQILKKFPNSSSLSVVAGVGSQGSGAQQLQYPTFAWVDSNGLLFVLDSGTYRVKVYPSNSTNGTAGYVVIGNNTARNTDNMIDHSYAMFIDGQNSIFISDTNNHRVMKYTGNYTNGIRVAGAGIQGANSEQLYSPRGIYVDDQGTLYVADSDNQRIQKYLQNASNGTILLSNLHSPYGLTMDTNGRLYVVESTSHRIIRWDPKSPRNYTCIAACSLTNGSAPNQLSTPLHIQLDVNGNLIISDSDNNRVVNFTIVNTPCPSTAVTGFSNQLTTSTPQSSVQKTESITTTVFSQYITSGISRISTPTLNISVCNLSNYSPYKISNGKANFDNAQTCCQSMNMTLVEIDSAKKQTRLMNMSIFIQDRFYIGLDPRCIASNYSRWLSGKSATYQNWDTGQPSACLLSRQCAIAANRTAGGQWKIVNCSDEFKFVCEPYIMFPYTVTRNTLLDSNTIHAAYAVETHQRTTIFEKVQVQSSSILQCAHECLMNENCIAIEFELGYCQLALN